MFSLMKRLLQYAVTVAAKLRPIAVLAKLLLDARALQLEARPDNRQRQRMPERQSGKGQRKQQARQEGSVKSGTVKSAAKEDERQTNEREEGFPPTFSKVETTVYACPYSPRRLARAVGCAARGSSGQ